MNQNAVYLIVAADALTPVNTLLDADRVRSLVVSARHLVHTIVYEAECRSVYNGCYVYAVCLQRLEQCRQLRPAWNTLEHNAVLLREWSCSLALLNCLLKVLS